jgi:hypothetical protein
MWHRCCRLQALLAAGNNEEALLRNCVMGFGYP